MGWLSYMFLGDLGQQLELNETRDEISRLREQVISARSEDSTSAHRDQLDRKVAALESENDDLKLYVAVLTRLLVQKGLVSNEEIAAMATAIDAEDGQADGRFSGPLA